MLLKFLPFSQKKEKNQSLSRQKSLQSEKQNEAFRNVGLNLLSKTPITKTLKFLPERFDPTTSFFRKTIFFLSFIMLFIISLNFFALFAINYLKIKQDNLIQQVKGYASVEANAKSIDKRTVYYKKLLSLRRSISSKVEFITNKTASDITVTNIRYTPEGFYISANGPDAYSCSKLISGYLSENVVSEIAIQGAKFNTRTGRFEIDMEGKFK